MNKAVNSFVNALTKHPEDFVFEQVMTLIDEHYDFNPTAFSNGTQHNGVGENSGSCKVFSFALMQGLNEEQTLCLFGQYYRDVKSTPEKQDHQNIRQFMQHGFARLSFEGQALSVKG